MTTTPATKLLLSVEDAADLLGVSRRTVYDLLRTRALAFVRIGRCRGSRSTCGRSTSTACRRETVDPITWARKIG